VFRAVTLAKLAALSLIVAAALTAALAAPEPAAAASGTVEGRVMSGKAPLRGFRVQLWQARPGAKRPQLLGTARSRGGGRFVLRHRRARRDAVHYLVANRTGGGGGAVPAFAYRLGASLGTGSVPGRATVNDRTTVAMAFALAQFLEGPRLAGASPGLENAATMSANLVDPRSGRLAGVLRRFPNGRSTSTLATFNSLANLVASCRSRGRACARLLRLARPPGRRLAAGDTLRALVAVARNPWHSSAALFRRSLAGRKPYRPFLGRGERPGAWTLALRFEGRRGTVNGPGGIAIDAEGSLWVANAFPYSRDPGAPVCGGKQLLRFTPAGRPHPGSPYEGGGLGGGGFGIGLDPRERVWVGSSGLAGRDCEEPPPGDSVAAFSDRGRPLGEFEAGGIERPMGTVADLDGNVWVAGCGGDAVVRYANGLESRAADLGDVGLSRPFGVAVGWRGLVFVTGSGNDRVAVLEPDGRLLSVAAGAGLDRPLGVATDSRGHAWVANSGSVTPPCAKRTIDLDRSAEGSVTLLSPDGEPLRSFGGAGLRAPWGVAVDGDDTVWVANFAGRRLSHLCGARPRRCPAGQRATGASISPTGSGYRFDGLTRNTGIAIDPSGNVWLSNSRRPSLDVANPGGHQIVAFLGLAAPIRTPLIGPPERP